MAEFPPELQELQDSSELEELPGFDTDLESGYEEMVEEEEEYEEAPEEMMDEEEFEGYVSLMLEDSIQYCDELSTDRVTASKYYSGHLPEQDDEGRSGATSYDTRDTINAILPSLMRVFFGANKVLRFNPKGPEDVEMSEQCTDYINNLILEQQPDFFKTMMSVFKDALIRRTGVLKFWHEETERVTSSQHTGLDEQQAQILAGDDDVESVEMEENGQTADGIPLFNVTLKRRIKEGNIKIEALPPEEFLISRTAKSVQTADIVAHRSYKTVSDLVALGYDREEVDEFSGTEQEFSNNEEYYNRHAENATRSQNNLEPASRKVLYCESYVRIDRDQDNYSELLRVCTIGAAHNVVNIMPCDQIPFVCLTPDPTPHSWDGSSITDIVADIQRIKSAILRNVMDSLVMAVNPRMMVQEGAVNMKDVLNTEVGAIIRAKNPNAVTQLSMPFVGQAALPILGMLDEIKASRTGITKVSQGLDVESLTSTAKVGIDAGVKAAQAHIELIARIFAETGLKPLYKGVLKLVCQHQDREKMVRLRNQWIPIDPRYWDSDMDVSVDIPLGGGSDIEKMQFLENIAQKQDTLLQQLGPENPIVSLKQYHLSLSKMVELAGFKDPSLFFNDPAQYQAPPQEEPQPSPEEKYIEIQGQKVQMDAQNDMQKLELEKEKMIRLDDREKDRNETQAQLQIMDMEAKYNTRMDSEKIRANLERNREEAKERKEMMLAQQKAQQEQMQAQEAAQAQQQQQPGMHQMPDGSMMPDSEMQQQPQPQIPPNG
jgi:hypothetical protein